MRTTPRYVRTILSEANISLMQLRKQYAKHMEHQLYRTRRQVLVQEIDPKSGWSKSKMQQLQNTLARTLIQICFGSANCSIYITIPVFVS